MRDNIEIFTGNRAEFYLLYPLIKRLAKTYTINLIYSGTHSLKKWNTRLDLLKKIAEIKNLVVHEIPLKMEDSIEEYARSFYKIGDYYIKRIYDKKYKPLFTLFLGDRIETYSFAISSLYLGKILVHISGGDIGNIPAYDTNVRHAITKISHLHLVTNKRSYNTLIQLGEEKWRIKNIGIPTLDYAQNEYKSKNYLIDKYKIKSSNIIVVTYHPDQYLDSSKLEIQFGELIRALEILCENFDIILTYPNNDPGHEIILKMLVRTDKRIKLVVNLGEDYVLLFKYFNIIAIGNSSSILTETPFFSVPALLLGGRQINRLRGKNVEEYIDFNADLIINRVYNIFTNYVTLKKSYSNKNRFIYGTGNSSVLTSDFLFKIFSSNTKSEIINKKFIEIFSEKG